jgi:hypothetical protein
MKSRKLTLKMERLAELNSEQMHEIAGGTNTQRNCLTLDLLPCLSIKICERTNQFECNFPTILPDTCLC